MKVLSTVVIALALGVSALACSSGSTDDVTPDADRPLPSSAFSPTNVGAPAPAYAITTLAGDSLVVGAGPDVVLLNVWATWCVSCKEEFSFMDELLAKHGPNGLRVVAVSVDVASTDAVVRVAKQYGVTFEIAHDADGRVESAFPAIGVPASYLIGRDGTLLWKIVGVLPPAVDSVISEALAASAD